MAVIWRFVLKSIFTHNSLVKFWIRAHGHSCSSKTKRYYQQNTSTRCQPDSQNHTQSHTCAHAPGLLLLDKRSALFLLIHEVKVESCTKTLKSVLKSSSVLTLDKILPCVLQPEWWSVVKVWWRPINRNVSFSLNQSPFVLCHNVYTQQTTKANVPGWISERFPCGVTSPISIAFY